MVLTEVPSATVALEYSLKRILPLEYLSAMLMNKFKDINKFKDEEKKLNLKLFHL